MIMKKVIIFDMGGVLVDLDVSRCKAAFKERLGYEKIDEIIDSSIQTGILGDMEIGKIDASDFRKAVLADSREGCRPEDVDYALQQILGEMEPYKAELLKMLSARYDLYMLSNNNPVCMPAVSEIFDRSGVPMSEIFRKCYISYQMRAMKPSVEFYRAVMDDIGVVSEEMLFIDDSMKNVEGALAAGLPAVCYVQGSDLRELLADALGDSQIREVQA